MKREVNNLISELFPLNMRFICKNNFLAEKNPKKTKQKKNKQKNKKTKTKQISVIDFFKSEIRYIFFQPGHSCSKHNQVVS